VAAAAASFADVPLAALRPLDLQLLRRRLRARWSRRTGKVLSEKTVSCVVNGSLRAMLRDAMVQDLLTRDVFVGLTWKSLEPPPVTRRTPGDLSPCWIRP
jgi:hypothetical protein